MLVLLDLLNCDMLLQNLLFNLVPQLLQQHNLLLTKMLFLQAIVLQFLLLQQDKNQQ